MVFATQRGLDHHFSFKKYTCGRQNFVNFKAKYAEALKRRNLAIKQTNIKQHLAGKSFIDSPKKRPRGKPLKSSDKAIIFDTFLNFLKEHSGNEKKVYEIMKIVDPELGKGEFL